MTTLWCISASDELPTKKFVWQSVVLLPSMNLVSSTLSMTIVGDQRTIINDMNCPYDDYIQKWRGAAR